MNLRLEYRDPADLTANKRNYRKHPTKQTDSLRDVIAEVGWAGALLYNEATGNLIDGHARKELFEGQQVPVLVGSWTEEQEKLILATLDPIAALADIDGEEFSRLISEVAVDSEAIKDLFNTVEEGIGAFDVDEADFPSLSDEEKTHGQMTFTLSNDQIDLVNQALAAARDLGPFAEDGNKNGLALARVCEVFLGKG